MSNPVEFAQPYIKPYMDGDTLDIAELIISEYLVAKKERGKDEIIFGYLIWDESDDQDGILAYNKEEDSLAPVNLHFDYLGDLMNCFQHAHYVQHKLGITGVRVVTGTGGCNEDDNVYHFYAHQNIAFNPRGEFIMVPKAQAKRITRKLLNKKDRW